jgi:spore coat protein U-like protein
MRGVRWLVSLSVLGAMVVISGRSASAQTCTVTVTPVSFGLYNVFSTTALTSTGTVTYSCTNQTYGADTITIWMSKGLGTTNNPRQMSGGIHSLNYYLCQDVACSKLWGDMGFPYDSGPITIPARTNLAASLPIYGKIPAGQDVPTGSYTDTILVEIDF